MERDEQIIKRTDSQIGERAREWFSLTNSGLRLKMGELTAQEIRSIKAVLNDIVGIYD